MFAAKMTGRCLIGLLKKKNKKINFGVFLYPKKNVFCQKWGYRDELGWVFGSNVPLAVLIPESFMLMCSKEKKCA